MTDTERDLIQRMATELDLYRQLLRDDCTSTHPLADEARAFLAQPEPEGPTDEEMIDLFWKHSSTIGDGGCGPGVGLAVEDAPALICDALARWGRPSIEPVTDGQT
jgi:hypothetical protein